MQIAAFQRKKKRPVLTTFDRMFWITVRSWWPEWRHPLMYVQADTVVRWQRERFRKFWASLSKPRGSGRGRPATAIELRRFIEQMAAANPLWRAPRIHGELKLLGIAISERTVSRILRKLRRPPTQTWKSFPHNHVGQMVSINFFNVPTFTMKVLFVFIMLEHGRRKVLHFHVTEHPTAAWTAQQICRGVSPIESLPVILSAIGTAVTAPRFDRESSPWEWKKSSQHLEVRGRIPTLSG
jgi:transposase